MLRLSQGQLKWLDECPRRFQLASLESLAVPPSPQQLAAQQWGDRFHLLMQQREMGLAIDPILDNDAELQTCLQTLKAQAPQLFDTTGEVFRQSEHERSLVFNHYWFTVVYDLLRLWGDRAEIVDWKTYLKPKSFQHLKDDWQTRLYLYVLVETSDYTPEQVALSYWFVRAENPETQVQEPQQVRIPYSTAAHTQTQTDLQRLTDQLTTYLERSEPLPQVPLGSQACDFCPFAVRCQRSFARTEQAVEVPGWDEIEEVVV